MMVRCPRSHKILLTDAVRKVLDPFEASVRQAESTWAIGQRFVYRPEWMQPTARLVELLSVQFTKFQCAALFKYDNKLIQTQGRLWI